jgi:hypothetical protein
VNPRLLAVALSFMFAATVGLALVAAAIDQPAPARADGPPVVDAPEEAEALAVLRAWDGRRARAWADGDVAALASLYAPGSRTGRDDRAMLAAYAGRGLRVSGLRMQVLAAGVRSWSPERFTIEVTDRVASAVAVRRSARVALPVDRPSGWLVSFVRVAGKWRVLEVQPAAESGPVASARASTASTSRSANP